MREKRGKNRLMDAEAINICFFIAKGDRTVAFAAGRERGEPYLRERSSNNNTTFTR